eukprot:TRINITY_DN23416_c0_g1_i1.p1 TRINITY_DN23416_c0_g1~~TRINITY_DN23416_c0_g1_i1.p1  ORF type:complete len:366 (-),score=80.66 TRINITY_DN23416_c0_g1_i1:216-1313(-)
MRGVALSAPLLVTVSGQDLFLAAKFFDLEYQTATNLDNFTTGTCPYEKGAKNCKDGCGGGMCFNSGARPGVLCKGQSTGYFCPPDSPPPGGDMAFACMDWTFGSAGMKKAEEAFNSRAGDDVRFGVGTYGTSDDIQRGLGACYRLSVDGMDKDLIVQSINTGSDVTGNQFDLQIGDGGAGAFNTCAGGSDPGHNTMYPGTYDESNWGKQYGGVDNKAQCKNLPKYPAKDAAMKSAGDDLVSLCEYGFDNGARMEGGGNPSIKSLGRVKCPSELVEMTQIQRNDDPSSYKCGSACHKAPHACALNTGGTSAEWCMTRMMDCRKPSGGFKDNVKVSVMVKGHKLVQPCTSDGYTRLDVQCGCFDCYC